MRQTNVKQRVTVIVVNHNAGPLLTECVEAALVQAMQVIVVDNDSSDYSLAMLAERFSHLPQLSVVVSGKNIGFAAGCNLGIASAPMDHHLLFLNPDCILGANALARMVMALQRAPEVGMVGGLLTNPDGGEQGGGRRAVPTPWRSFVRAFGLSALSNRWPRLFFDFHLHKQPLPTHPIEVEAISGALMLVKRTAIKNVGVWDEGYFLHCEDLDWCMRFRQKNWKILFVPNASVVHYSGHSSKARPFFVEWHKHKGMVRFYRKFFSHQYPGALMWLVRLGVWVRFGLVSVKHAVGLGLTRVRSGGARNPAACFVHETDPGSDANVLGLLGASSLVGQSVLAQLHFHSMAVGGKAQARSVNAYSRTPQAHAASAGVRWYGLNGAESKAPKDPVAQWICLAPIWALHEHFDLMLRCGARRIVALSSTSRFTKQLGAGSDDPAEHALAQRLETAEAQFTQWADDHSIEWVILRPTLIYGLGRDKNLTEIARFIRRFGFFPLLGPASGLRQPIHTDDVACAALAALNSTAALQHAYNISGGETVTYREMVARVFQAQGLRPRFIQVPLLFFRWGVALLRVIPRYKHWTPAMAQRMNMDMVFDHSDAVTDFGFTARVFLAE